MSLLNLTLSQFVKHLSKDDGLNSVSISNVTRGLEKNDVQIVKKVNEIIAELSSDRQFIAIPIPRIALPSLASEIVANFRIPAGYQVKIFNAAISSTPINQATLEVIYSAGTFGSDGSGGDILVSTLSEYTAGTIAVGTGELVMKVTNMTTKRVIVVGSVTVTVTLKAS